MGMRTREEMERDPFWLVKYMWNSRFKRHHEFHLQTTERRKWLADAYRKLADAIEEGYL